MLAAALALSAACASGKENVDITKPVTGEASTNAEKAYRRGLQEKASSSYLEATRYFEWVRNNFPYSQYAALAELALADMAFERDDFVGSAAAYADFVKSHPSHPKAGYASYRIGLSHFADRSSELFLLPPAQEKDQAPVRAALEALQKFMRAYPKDELVTDAQKLISDCRDRLAAHERYVADFYWKKGAWKGAAGRYLALADTYGDLDGGRVKADALWRASESLQRAGQIDEEREVLERLVAESPSGEQRRRAEQRLASLPKPKPAPATDGTTPAAPAPAPEGKPAAPGGTTPAAPAPAPEGKPAEPAKP